MRQAGELGTVEGDCLFQGSKQKLILSGEIALLWRAKVFILGAVSGMEACGVSGEGFFSLESQECQMQTSGLCPARMLRVVWGGCCEGILTKGSFAFRYRMLQAWDLSSESKEFFWMQSRR